MKEKDKTNVTNFYFASIIENFTMFILYSRIKENKRNVKIKK